MICGETITGSDGNKNDKNTNKNNYTHSDYLKQDFEEHFTLLLARPDVEIY